jgi:hypothetical protein
MADEPVVTQPAPRTGAGLAAKLGAKIANRDNLNKALKAELATATAALAAATAKPTNEALQTELATLKADALAGRHKAEFTKAAKAQGIPEARIDDLFALSKYKAEGEPVEATVAAAVTAAIEPRKDWIGAEPAAAPVLGKGIGGGKGKTDTVTSGAAPTREQLSDPEWCWANQEAQRAAAKIMV